MFVSVDRRTHRHRRIRLPRRRFRGRSRLPTRITSNRKRHHPLLPGELQRDDIPPPEVLRAHSGPSRAAGPLGEGTFGPRAVLGGRAKASTTRPPSSGGVRDGRSSVSAPDTNQKPVTPMSQSLMLIRGTSRPARSGQGRATGPQHRPLRQPARPTPLSAVPQEPRRCGRLHRWCAGCCTSRSRCSVSRRMSRAKRYEISTPFTKNHLGTVTSAKPLHPDHTRHDRREIRHPHHRGREQPGAAGPLGEAFPHPICGGRSCHVGLPYSGVRKPRVFCGQRFG